MMPRKHLFNCSFDTVFILMILTLLQFSSAVVNTHAYKRNHHFSNYVESVHSRKELLKLLQNDSWKGIIRLPATAEPSPALWNNKVDALLRYDTILFDQTITLPIEEFPIGTMNEFHAAIAVQFMHPLLPKGLLDSLLNIDTSSTESVMNSAYQPVQRLLVDMYELAAIMAHSCKHDNLINSSSKKGAVQCRLQKLAKVRCPKWHEDYVHSRLICSYLGPGSEWVDPGNHMIRLINSVLRQPWWDQDATVLNPQDIQRAATQEILVLSGRLRMEKMKGVLPVLHRSPVSVYDDKKNVNSVDSKTHVDTFETLESPYRLLYTVTVE